jgi:predicted transglutaminase-like cysteine proteinase
MPAGEMYMAQNFKVRLLAFVTAALLTSGSQALSQPGPSSSVPAYIAAGSPALAPFQHVRFCLRYPADCRSGSTPDERIELTEDTVSLLNKINAKVNMSISPFVKGYRENLDDGWTISPIAGDCNDYAVTKRHELLASGLSPSALRLAVVRTLAGAGHLVLVVATTKGDIVLDNLSAVIRPWQNTGYRWLKIQSAMNAKYWNDVKEITSDPVASLRDQRLNFANR